MHLQANNQVNELKENLFERALKRISVQAFDALLTCGVRNLNGLLHLTSEDMRKAGLSKHIISELMSIPLQFSEYATELDRQSSEMIYHAASSEVSTVITPLNVVDSVSIQRGRKNVLKKIILRDISVQAVQEVRQEPNRETDSILPDQKNGTPIPNELIEGLPTRARNVLIRENIQTIVRLLEFQESNLYTIAGIGSKTVADIEQLQDIVRKCPLQIPRACFHSRTSEHWISDPADWSLLSQTLPNLFWVTLPSLNDFDYEENVTLSDLGIPTSDMYKFREIVLFPEDSADLLFSITLGCLLKVSISDNTFTVLLDYIERFTGGPNLSKKFVTTAKVSDTPVFADLQTESIEEFRIPKLLYQDLFEIFENNKLAITWRDIAKISERNVIKHFGFTLQGLKAIKHLWLLKEHAFKFIKRISEGLPTEAYSSFSNLADTFVRSIIKKDYHYSVVMGRLGFLDERKWTLEELGQRLNLTRERIRQIEKMYMPVLEKPKILDRLNLLWYAVDESLKTGGGVCCVSEIADSLQDCWKWAALPSGEALASLISLSAKYEVVWVDPIRIIMPIHGCVNCSKIGPVLTSGVESQPNGILSFDEAAEIMRKFCQSRSCNTLSEIHRISKGFLHFLDDAIEEILADEKDFYTQFAWGVKYGMRRTTLVEQIIFNSGKAMHFKEVHIEANKDRPAHGQLSDRSIYGNLDRSSALLLWGPGTFIHKELVTIPVSLISKIENDIILRLNTHKIPYLSITGIFEGYKHNLLAEGIPSANALYSCMRITNNKALDCPDYPYVLRRESEGMRLPIPLVLEAFVLEQEGVVTLDHIKSFAIEKLCVNEAVFMISHLPNIPNLLRINRCEYIHLNQLAIEKDTLSPIIDHLIKLLEKYDHVSANLLYDQKKISCRLLGISTPMLLFSLVQLFYSDQFDFTRYPQIRTSGVAAEDNRTAGVSSEVLNYIRDKALPCSFIELYQRFVDELGYKQYSVHNVLYTYKNLLRYSEGVIVHLETIGWSEDKQATLETLAANHLSNRKNTGKPYGLVSHLYDDMYDKLPELPDQISWTPTLIGELLSSGGRYRIIGTQRNAFVSVPNSYSIKSLDDLMYYILDTNYDGAANIDQFISDMREAGILIKSITSIMLGADSRVVIDGNVVKLAGLSNRAEGT